jgi:hypothetical protein
MTKSSDFVARSGGIRKVDPGPARFSYPAGRSGQTIGPVCVGCAHPTCRTIRAQALPRLGGHRSESREHAQAAAIQARTPHTVVWWGEATQSFWAVVDCALHEAADVDALLLALWPGPDPAAGSARTPEPEVEVESAPAPVRIFVPASGPVLVLAAATGPTPAPLRTAAVRAAEANGVPLQDSPWVGAGGRASSGFGYRTPRSRPLWSPHPAPPPAPVPRPRPHPEPHHRTLARR